MSVKSGYQGLQTATSAMSQLKSRNEAGNQGQTCATAKRRVTTLANRIAPAPEGVPVAA